MNASKDLKLKKDQVFVSRINGRIKQAIARAANSEGISMTAYIERLVQADLRERKLLPMINEIVN